MIANILAISAIAFPNINPLIWIDNLDLLRWEAMMRVFESYQKNLSSTKDDEEEGISNSDNITDLTEQEIEEKFPILNSDRIELQRLKNLLQVHGIKKDDIREKIKVLEEKLANQ